MAAPTTQTELLKIQAHELIKSHTAYDGTNRVSAVYMTNAGAANGAACTVVTYTYDSTSSRVVGMKEAYGTWDSAWDI